MELTVATANVAGDLSRREAARSLTTVLATEPDLVGLQEWHPSRRRLLRAHPGYGWRAPLLGGCVVGWRRDRFTGMRGRVVALSGPGLRVRADRLLEPGRLANLVRGTDTLSGRRVCLVSFHLVYGVQAGGRYREDRPRVVARHRAEHARLGALVARLVAEGTEVYAVGDSNFHGLALPPLVSAWGGRPGGPGTGTLGSHRRVDDVFAATAPEEVRLVATASDHLAVVAGWTR